jgi:hypothetical protein
MLGEGQIKQTLLEGCILIKFGDLSVHSKLLSISDGMVDVASASDCCLLVQHMLKLSACP